VFLDLYKDYKGIIDAMILTATPLDPKLKGEMLNIIKKIVGEEKKIEVKEEIEEELIGGFKILIGDNLLDGSISSQLRELRQKLVV
jgi:F-type H+-transporting ATPase subunit delta